MIRARIRLFVAAATALGLAGCSMFREGESRPIEASLNGDDGRLEDLVDAISVSAAPPSDVAASSHWGSGVDAAASPAAERSVLYALHIASYRTETSAAAGWRIIAAEAADQLAGLHPRLEAVDLGADRGVYLRLKAGPLDSRADAVARCAALVEAGHYCKTADFEGREISG